MSIADKPICIIDSEEVAAKGSLQRRTNLLPKNLAGFKNLASHYSTGQIVARDIMRRSM
jgi:hypothetical protein